jgi:hypothetical protein
LNPVKTSSTSGSAGVSNLRASVIGVDATTHTAASADAHHIEISVPHFDVVPRNEGNIILEIDNEWIRVN